MSENFSNTSTEKTNVFSKGMVKDLTDIFMSEGMWVNALNAVNNSHTGDTGSIGNEPSNKRCASLALTIVGYAHINLTRWAIFSTNGVISEIGIFDEGICEYKKVVAAECLNFKTTHLISAVVKKNYDCTYSAYFVDNLNPDRVINLDNPPFVVIGDSIIDPECYEPIYDYNQLDCDKLRLHPIQQQPCVTVEKAQGSGQLTNGSYMACVAYSENGIRVTDYSIPSTPQPIWDHSGIGGSIDITVSNLDQNFEEYELVVVIVVNQQTIAKKIGNYSIRQSKVTLDTILQSLITVDLAQIPLKSIVYEKSEKIASVNGYLIRSGVTTQPYFNYQAQANEIRVRWVATLYDANYYYKSGNKVGYMRDEVYPFFIRWVFKTGSRSASFHIPGRVANDRDLEIISTNDVVNGGSSPAWKVYDTSSSFNVSEPRPDGGVIIAKGDMGYWESTERYPDDKVNVWGDLCGKPIRHHKMPSNETTHIHAQNGEKISILGVEFLNIIHPKDQTGRPIPEIVGYEILRGSREGNRSILAKGMFNNMIEYDINGSVQKGLFQNYPYNDLRPDGFLTDDYTTIEKNSASFLENLVGLENSISKLDKHLKNIFSFHSVETSFVKPYLGENHIKLYTEERGVAIGKFEVPYKHPKHVLISGFAFGIAAIIGAGIAIVNTLGKTSTGGQLWAAPLGVGVLKTSQSESTPANIIVQAIEALVSDPAGQAGKTAATLVALGTQSAFYFGQGVKEALELIKNVIKNRDYALQFNSHAFYSNSSTVFNNDVPSGYITSITRKIQENGAKYIGSGVQEFDSTHRINNINRNKYVAVKLINDVPNPSSILDTTRHRIKDEVTVNHINPLSADVINATVAYYGAIKVDYENQYGQLSSIVQIPTDSCVLFSSDYTYDNPNSVGPVFGGDVYINRYTEKNPYMFFNTWQYDVPDRTEFDYRNYLNGPAPRYWANFENFDMSDFDIDIKLSHAFDGNPDTQVLENTTPRDFHHLDRPALFQIGGEGKLLSMAVKDAYMYLFYNGVRDFFTESELNMAFRDYGESDHEKFYDSVGGSFADLKVMFRSDKITQPIYHKYDLSLSTSKLFNNFASWGSILPRDYDPALYSTCFQYYPNRAVYSLQQQDGLKRDNWRNFLPLNYKDFKGKINIIKSLNATGAMILFEDAEPTMFVGVDQLQTQGGVKVTIGDGGLFQGNMQSLVNADDAQGYASSISSRASVNTPHGMFFVSQQSGKIFQYSNGLKEISRNGMKHWFNEHLPSKILEKYPDFPYYDNPVMGAGVQAVYDPQFEIVYFTKRDFTPLRDDLYFDDPSGQPYYFCQRESIPEEYLRCVRRVVTGVQTAGLNQNGSWTFIWSAPSKLAYENAPETYKLTLKAAITTTNPTTILSTETISANLNEYVFSGNYNLETGMHLLNNSTLYQLEIEVGYSCGVIRTIITGTVAQFITSTATVTYPQGTVTVEPPSGILPECYITATSTDILAGKGTTLIWDASSSVSATLNGTPVALSGNMFVNPGLTTTYTLDITSSGNVVTNCSVEITVTGGAIVLPQKCPCEYTDPRCFERCDWTISYDPKIEQWVSFHSWNPSLVMPSLKHFFTINNNTIWKHNDRWDNFCNFYGDDYPWEIEYPVVTPNNVTTLRNIEYTMDVYKYYNEGQDFHHILDQNFDRALVYNTEQISGLLKLKLKGKKSPLDLVNYPQVSASGIEILYSKEENKYSFNQFWDITNDRGEFTLNRKPMFETNCAGTTKEINPEYINYFKSSLERKKFRHYGNNILLRRNKSDDNKFILKLTSTKHLRSSR